jgi:CRISPR/Cas system CSM-associated protein Csm2 small subunit
VLLITLIPSLDLFLAIKRRLLSNRSIASADRQHLHHRALGLGLSDKVSMLSFSFLGFIFTCFAYIVDRQNSLRASVIGVCVLSLAAFLLVFLAYFENRQIHQAKELTLLLDEHRAFGALNPKQMHSTYKKWINRSLKNGQLQFALMIYDPSEPLQQMITLGSEQLADFHTEVFRAIRSRIRLEDLLVRHMQHRWLIFLADFPENELNQSGSNLENALNDRLQEVEEKFGVFQVHKNRAQGLIAYHYPRDRKLIEQIVYSLGAENAKEVA